MGKSNKELYEMAIKEFEETIERLRDDKELAGIIKEEGLGPADIVLSNVAARMRGPEAIHEWNLPIFNDKGRVETFTGWEVVDSTTRGPAKGGITFSSSTDIFSVMLKGVLMTRKSSLFNLPFGGAKGGVNCDPKSRSRSELRKLTTRYSNELATVIGPWKIIPAPDVGTNERTMAIIYDVYKEKTGDSCFAVVTGKPVDYGGVPGRREATGRGAFIITLEILKHLGTDPKGKTCVIQGAGNVGGVAAELLHHNGFKVIGISDSSGGIFNPIGIDIPNALRYKEETGHLKDFPGCDNVVGEDEFLSLPCDILGLMAKEGVVTEKNAPGVKAKVVICPANAPITPDGEKILLDRGIFVSADSLDSGGGVNGSWCEWSQNLGGAQWELEDVNRMIDKKMKAAFNEVLSLSQEKKVSMKQAALMLAIKRVVKAKIVYPLWP